uniref:Carotenoid oxygenase family protein n=1 Tax=Desertifilum tharense IPPAS B-1220 TaxID=1781255 RepID=A0ACD5GTH5_9CYAN
MFILSGSVGSVAAEADSHSPIVKPSQDGTTLLYNGEGMVYRLDFDALEQGVSLTTRIMKTPCYYADLGTFYDPKYQGSQNSPDLRFKNLGISRVSGRLGLRNQLNTAFLPVRFAEEGCDRLLVTWDMGRPYELDPVTLEAVTPIGRNDEWEPATKLISLPFEPPPLFRRSKRRTIPVSIPIQMADRW